MRYTHKNNCEDSYDGVTIDYVAYDEEGIVHGLNKLGRIEDIEDSILIEVEIVYKAWKNGIWRKMQDGIVFLEPESIIVTFNGIICDSGKELRFWDYGDKWALTKDELE